MYIKYLLKPTYWNLTMEAVAQWGTALVEHSESIFENKSLRHFIRNLNIPVGGLKGNTPCLATKQPNYRSLIVTMTKKLVIIMTFFSYLFYLKCAGIIPSLLWLRNSLAYYIVMCIVIILIKKIQLIGSLLVLLLHSCLTCAGKYFVPYYFCIEYVLKVWRIPVHQNLCK